MITIKYYQNLSASQKNIEENNSIQLWFLLSGKRNSCNIFI